MNWSVMMLNFKTSTNRYGFLTGQHVMWLSDVIISDGRRKTSEKTSDQAETSDQACDGEFIF